jgi:hypothetical protein
MTRMRRQAVAIVLVVAGIMAAAAGGSACRAAARTIEAGFWFEPVTFDLRSRGGPLTATDIDAIEAVAADELARGFAGLRVAITDRRDATYTVRVVQQLNDPRHRRRRMALAGQSRGSRFGGSGAVNFEMMAHGAVAFAPPDADRAALLAAIGTGVGRTAVHELTHMLLPSANIHASTDVASYEYESAGRAEHFYGDARWDLARPLLQKRVGMAAAPSR